MRWLIQRFKQLLTILGSWLPRRFILALLYILNYVRLGRWMRDHDFHFKTRLPNRESCWEFVASKLENKPVLYLEFGVNQGESFRKWCALLKHPGSEFHGFDSFEGMSETFDERERIVRGTFAQAGHMPNVD